MFFGSHLFQIIEIKKKTRAKGFKDVERGDELQFSLDLQYTTGASSGLYASNIRTVHMRGFEEIGIWHTSQNMFLNTISCFGFVIKEKTLNIRDLEDHLEEIERDYK